MNDSNTSLASSNCKYGEMPTVLEYIAKYTAYALLVVLGIICNIFIIVLAIKYTVRKNLHHLIISMAVSDALYLSVGPLYTFPLLSENKLTIYPNGITGVIICKTTTFLFEISYRVSLFTLLVISIERFRATRRTLQRLRPYTLKQRVAVLGVCWLPPMSAAVCFTYASKTSNGSCKVPREPFKTNLVLRYFVIAFDILTVIVCFVIFFFSILTLRRLSKPQSIQAHFSEEQRNIRVRRAQAAVRMVLVSLLLYTCCWLASFVYNVVWSVDFIFPSAKILDVAVCIDWSSLLYSLYFLPILNSCCSPCVYIIFLSDFREAAKKVLCRRERLNQVANTRNSIEMQPMPSH